MKKIIIMIVLLFVTTALPANALYVIDGDISDWGIDLGAIGADLKGYLDAHVPGGNVDYVTEDNVDKNDGRVFVGPGYSLGNRYDAEAMYFDNDDTYAYFAIVSGLPSDEIEFPAGDIFFSTTANPFSDLSYEYAIDVFNGNVYDVGGVEDVFYSKHAAANPWRLTRDDFGSVALENAILGVSDLVYSELNNTHTVIEGRVPLAMISAGDTVWMHWTMECGNDVLNLEGHVVPEPLTVVLFGSGVLGFFGLKRRQRNF